MKIHEYQAKEIFAQYGIPVPPGRVAQSPKMARMIAAEIGCPVMVKAQVHVGGRGKAGGVKQAQNPEEASDLTSKILGMRIKGLAVRKVLIYRALEVRNETYMGIIVDRRSQLPVVMVSAAGGVDIEQVARETPEKIHKLAVDPMFGLLDFQARDLTLRIYDDSKIALQAANLLMQLYRVFWERDANLVEINPLIVSADNKLWALDAKFDADDNSLFRQEQIAEMRDLQAEIPEEMAAREKGLSYVKLDGTVGCVVNGAGLAMSTMDLITHYGGEPANFLDIGGSSSPEKVKAAVEFLLKDPDVKVILFNILGGITRCDDVANGLLLAMEGMERKHLPVVIRLTGTTSEKAKEILKQAHLAALDSMEEAVQQAVQLAKT
jgi:succinyl-CoA synthetase beta subunit